MRFLLKFAISHFKSHAKIAIFAEICTSEFEMNLKSHAKIAFFVEKSNLESEIKHEKYDLYRILQFRI